MEGQRSWAEGRRGKGGGRELQESHDGWGAVGVEGVEPTGAFSLYTKSRAASVSTRGFGAGTEIWEVV